MVEIFSEAKSIDPKYWGKCGWIFLNSIALTYEPIHKEKYRQFILQLPYILPCKRCGENLKKNIPNLDLALKSKDNFLKWLINIRNEIYVDNNLEWKQKNFKQTINEIFNSNSTTNTNSYIYILFCTMILIILIITILNLKNY